MEKYEVSTVAGTFYVSKAGIDSLVPLFKEEWDKFIGELEAKPSHTQPPMLKYAQSLEFPSDGQMLAVLLVLPFMSYGKSEGDKLSLDAFAKQFGQEWFSLKSGSREEQKGILDIMVSLVDVASSAIGVYGTELGMVSGHPYPVYVTSFLEGSDELYDSLELEFEAAVASERYGLKPSKAPIEYKEVPWGAGCSKEFKAQQSEEVKAAFIAQATAASSDAYIVDPYLATAYLAWKAL